MVEDIEKDVTNCSSLFSFQRGEEKEKKKEKIKCF